MSNVDLRIFGLFIVYLITILSCSVPKISKLELKQQESFESWKAQRISDLKKPFGWHSLIGLYWIKKDSLSLGTKEGFDISLDHHASANLGTVIHKNDLWFFKPAQKNLVKHDGQFVNEAIEIQDDYAGNPTILNFESLFWYVIKREDNYGIRLKDTLNPARMEFNRIPTFDYDDGFVKNAKVKWASIQDSILITNAQGVVGSIPLKGWLTFNHEGESYSLAGTDGGNNNWFIVFGDETNSGETYGAGRFLYVPVSEASKTVTLDFNRAENPPCYFTAFATCPLPPQENKLPIEILAGEQAEH